MSTLSLPSYVAPSIHSTPSYSAEPQDREQRLAFVDRLRRRPAGDLTKTSKGGEMTIRFNAQGDNMYLPVYGIEGAVKGTVDLHKSEGVDKVTMKMEGFLRIKELGEGGTTVAVLCSERATLWTRDGGGSDHCPSSMVFSFQLPTEFTHARETYPLPPSFSDRLPGLPGFVATVEYTVTASAIKSGHLPHVKSKSLGIRIGESSVTTPFIYYPRSRPNKETPRGLTYNPALGDFDHGPEWAVFESTMKARNVSKQNILLKLRVPSARVFPMSDPIPFYLTLVSSAVSLAAYLPLSPTGSRKVTRIQLMRQTTVDVRNTTIAGVKTDMWRIDCLGEGTFEMVSNGPTSICFKGEIRVDPNVKIPAFKAAGLSIKDCLLLTVNTLESAHWKAPFGDVRLGVPVRLSTERASSNGAGLGAVSVWARTTPSPEAVESNSMNGDGDDATIHG